MSRHAEGDGVVLVVWRPQTFSTLICYYRGALHSVVVKNSSSGIRTRAEASEFWVHQMMMVDKRRACGRSED